MGGGSPQTGTSGFPMGAGVGGAAAPPQQINPPHAGVLGDPMLSPPQQVMPPSANDPMQGGQPQQPPWRFPPMPRQWMNGNVNPAAANIWAARGITQSPNDIGVGELMHHLTRGSFQ